MIEYVYIVKCPNCEDEHFNFFDEAKEYAASMLSKKPIITQTEVHRNDFGECTDHYDLGTVWTWEALMSDVADELADNSESVFNKADTLEDNDCAFDQEFSTIDNSVDFDPRMPIPEGMTIEALVEEMEDNEDTVECKWCGELFGKDQCRKEVDLGWLCSRCEMAIKSRGETLTFREGSYWDFLDEKLNIDFSDCVSSSDMEIWGLDRVQDGVYKAVLLKHFENVSLQGFDESQKVTDEMYDIDGAFTFYFLKDGSPDLYSWNVNLLRKLGRVRIDFEDDRYATAVTNTLNRKPALEESEETPEANKQPTPAHVEILADDTVLITFSDLTTYDGEQWVYETTADDAVDYIIDYITDEDIADLTEGRFVTYDEFWAYIQQNGGDLWSQFIESNAAELVDRHQLELLDEIRATAEAECERECASAEQEASGETFDGFSSYNDFCQWRNT